jgi:hypothetical protein
MGQVVQERTESCPDQKQPAEGGDVFRATMNGGIDSTLQLSAISHLANILVNENWVVPLALHVSVCVCTCVYVCCMYVYVRVRGCIYVCV